MSDLSIFDMTAHLGSDADAAEYLCQVLEDGDTDELPRALGHIARAKGMAIIGERAGLRRESLYKALTPGANPRFDTIMRVIKPLGVRLQDCLGLRMNNCTVQATWDDEARVWVSTSDDISGLATEAETVEALTDKLKIIIPELLENRDSPANAVLKRNGLPQAF